jgi:hypothetical protein
MRTTTGSEYALQSVREGQTNARLRPWLCGATSTTSTARKMIFSAPALAREYGPDRLYRMHDKRNSHASGTASWKHRVDRTSVH